MSAHATPAKAPAEVTPAPLTLRWAVRLLVIQAVAVAGLSVLLIYADLTAEANSLRSELIVTAFAILSAVVLAMLGQALARRRGWARGPAIVLQMLLIPMGYYMIVGGIPWLGVPVLAIGLGGSAMLLAPATREALGLNRGITT